MSFTYNWVSKLIGFLKYYELYNLHIMGFICRDIERFLQEGWDPNQLGYDGVSPMHLAAGLGMKEVCMLLQHGGDPNIR